jgi:hypothetical protein
VAHRAITLVAFILVSAACSPDHRPSPEVTADTTSADSVPATAIFTRHSGGTIQTTLGYGIVLNSRSAMAREWVVANDSMLPVRLATPTGVRTVYESGGRYSSGSYQYTADIEIETRDSISAFEIRFVLFDVWGEFVKTLTMTEVEDIAPGTRKSFNPKWSLYSENEASEHYASIGYVARVRNSQGRVYEANYHPIVEEARKFSARFTPEQLDPYRRPPRDSAAVAVR